MGRITDTIPALYHSGDNDLTRFTDILDSEVIRELEQSTRGITNLINVDRCPDDKLPYLAAIINCPLIGDDPIFWRKQIRNWPYILRLKGTQRSLELVIDSIGIIEDSSIKTFFRDERGRYVVTKPSGEPFLDANGLWRNIRTHYFGIDLTLSKNFVESKNFDWDETDISEKLKFWFEHGKPYHSELLHLSILPPDFLPDGHICHWDDCIWGHPFIELHDWGLLHLPVFENDPAAGIEFVHGLNVVSDTQLWDVSVWGRTPYRELLYGKNFEHCIFADLERESTATWYIPYIWGDFTWKDSERYSRDFEFDFQRGAINVNADIKSQPSGRVCVIGMLVSLQPFWDSHTWSQNESWVGMLYREPIYGHKVERGILADLERENTATWYIPYSWRKFVTGNSERYSRDLDFYFERGAKVETNIRPQPFGTVYVVDMFASLQPYWDFYTWAQRGNWGDIFGVPRFAPAFQRDNKASVQWNEAEAPYAKWSKFRTWGNATWDKAPTSAGTWETGSWIDDLEEAV